MRKLLPKDIAGWVKLGVFPFQAYIIIAPLCVIPYVAMIGRSYAGWGDFLPSVLEGYAVSFVALLTGSVVQFAINRRESALVTFLFAIAAAFSAWFTFVCTARG